MELLFTFNAYPFISVTSGVFVLFVLIYVLRSKQKTGITWQFVGIFTSLLLLQGVFFFTNITTFWGRAFWPMQLVCGLLCGIFILQFVYHFPQCDQPSEAVWSARILIALTCIAFIYVLYYAYQTITQSWSFSRMPHVYFLLLTPLVIAFLLVAILRRISVYAELTVSASLASWGAYGRALAKVLVRPPNPIVLTFRNLILTIMIGLLPAIAPALGISALSNLYLVTFGTIWFTAALGLIYFNHAAHSVTILVKIMGISLVSLLTFLGMVGTEQIVTDRDEHIRHMQLEILATQHALRTDSFSDLPPSILYVAVWSLSADPYASTPVFIHPAYTPDDVRAFLAVAPETDFPKARKLLADRLSQIRTYLLTPNSYWVKYLGYRFIRQNQQYEIGVSFERYHELGGARLFHLIFQVIACCVLVIVLFPLFFRVNLVTPLKRLLDGVEQVNAGHLEHVIPVEYDDEIGFLTRVFNQMTHSLKISNQQKDNLNIALQQANDELEERVQQRTNELRKAKEAAEEARQMAEDANQAKSIFLANMSHELRTPLNVILGFAQVMERNQKLSPEQQEQVQAINRSGEHLLALINQVLDLSKIEADQMMVNEESIDLYQLLEELEEMFCLQAQDKNLRLTFEYASDLPRYVSTDTVKLRQILINLLNNAIKFTEKGSVALVVSASSQRGTAAKQSDVQERHSEDFAPHYEHLYFTISDTGPGIAAEELETIFEAFTQATTDETERAGTGLGLTISRKFVELMGGELTVESTPGQGSAFSVVLPVRRVRTEDVAEKAVAHHVVALEPNQRAADGSRYRILLADDHRDNRQVLVRILQSLRPQTQEESEEGFELQEAENGQRAVEIWKTWQPHLIFMDIRMPVMDGYEAIQQIRLLERQKAEARRQKADPLAPSPVTLNPVRIIALTASTFEEEKADMLKIGCDAYIRKPFRESTLFEMVAQYLNIRYVYAEKDTRHERTIHKPALGASALANLSDDMRMRFTQAITTLDIESLRTLIMRIRIDNAVLADALEELVNSYQFETLSTLFAGEEVH